MTPSVTVYEKRNSFHEMHFAKGDTKPEAQTERALRVLKSETISMLSKAHESVLSMVVEALQSDSPDNGGTFSITPFVADEMHLLSDDEIPYYLYHRFRYDQFPLRRELDDYPPYLQIEPSSICNYRCLFCYQTDASFSNNKSKHMGSMSIDLFKKIVDEAEGNIEFISLASRGEPLVCKDFSGMIEYSIGKFLNLKINTNASLITEKHCHALLCGGARTVVFSADAAEEPLYSQLRVNGKLNRVLRNIEMFQKIREIQYSKTKIISRVSGVLVDETQNMRAMQKLWGGLVDQISFVKYNPWENVYEALLSRVDEPCSDLWRRMFIWFDGTVNPCDTDYKSQLSVGNLNGSSISKYWKGNEYQTLRNKHEQGKRKSVGPCNRCVVV